MQTGLCAVFQHYPHGSTCRSMLFTVYHSSRVLISVPRSAGTSQREDHLQCLTDSQSLKIDKNSCPSPRLRLARGRATAGGSRESGPDTLPPCKHARKYGERVSRWCVTDRRAADAVRGEPTTVCVRAVCVSATGPAFSMISLARQWHWICRNKYAWQGDRVTGRPTEGHNTVPSLCKNLTGLCSSQCV